MVYGDRRYRTGAESWSEAFQAAMGGLTTGLKDYRNYSLQKEQLELQKNRDELEGNKLAWTKKMDMLNSQRDRAKLALDQSFKLMQIENERFGILQQSHDNQLNREYNERKTAVDNAYKASEFAGNTLAIFKEDEMATGSALSEITKQMYDAYVTEKQQPMMPAEQGYGQTGVVMPSMGRISSRGMSTTLELVDDTIIDKLWDANQSDFKKAGLTGEMLARRFVQDVPNIIEGFESGTISPTMVSKLQKAIASPTATGFDRPAFHSYVGRNLSSTEKELVVMAYLLSMNKHDKFKKKILTRDFSDLVRRFDTVVTNKREHNTAVAKHIAAEQKYISSGVAFKLLSGPLNSKITEKGGWAYITQELTERSYEYALATDQMLDGRGIPISYRKAIFREAGFPENIIERLTEARRLKYQKIREKNRRKRYGKAIEKQEEKPGGLISGFGVSSELESYDRDSFTADSHLFFVPELPEGTKQREE